MSITCGFFGHRFSHIAGSETGTWTRGMYGNEVVRDWHKTLRVSKRCDRCGYESSDSFAVPVNWMAKPEVE